MCKKWCLLLLCVLVFGIAGTALAVNCDFGAFTSDSWHLGENWYNPVNPGVKPGPDDNAFIHHPGINVGFYAGESEHVTNASVGYNANPTGTNTMTMLGGYLRVESEFSVGALWSDWGGNNAGVLDMYDGNIEAYAWPTIGEYTAGTVNMYGGRLWGQWQILIGDYGTVNLNEGTVESLCLLTMTPGSLMIIDNGLLKVDGAWQGTGAIDRINAYVSMGMIQAYPGYTLVVETYDMWGGADVGVLVYADAPEPRPDLGAAWNPEPDNGKTVIPESNTVTLEWSSGDWTVSHDVYFGTNYNDVNLAERLNGDINNDLEVNSVDLDILACQWLSDSPSAGVNLNGDQYVNLADFAIVANNWLRQADEVYKGNQSGSNYVVDNLEIGQTYHWRIDEINYSNPDSPWKGEVWSFTTSSPLPHISVQNGVFVYPDASEVALFGTGYHPMSWYQYLNMRACSANFRQAIKQDVADMKACGIQIVRIQVFESEICDANGNLIANQHLDIFDILVDELNQQGIYLYLVPLGWWDTPFALPDAYSRHVSKMGMMYVESALSASENFINQFLTHCNPYTGKMLKDENILAIFEIINEPWYWPYEAIINPNFDPGFLAWQTDPDVYSSDLDLWKQLYQDYRTQEQLPPCEGTYEKFQCAKMHTFLQRMMTAIQQTGADQPIASALMETYRNPGILRAIGESAVDAVTDGWYIGGFDTLHEYVNQMSDAQAQAYQLPQQVIHKAKMVYEFDICRTYNNVIMYPAMARRWRSMGAQICCQFQYDSAVTASYNTDWGTHYFNYEYTPAKAVAFKIAAETFAAIPRGTQYPTPTDNEVFYGTGLSFMHTQTLRVADNQVYHAHPLEGWIPLELPSSPTQIMGRGNSAYAEYTGSGLYVLEVVSPNEIQLRTTRNAVVQGEINKEWFDNGTLGVSRVVLNDTPETFMLKLEGWDTFTCLDENGIDVQVTQGSFAVVPGKVYYLHK